jgi:hypothetical protein
VKSGKQKRKINIIYEKSKSLESISIFCLLVNTIGRIIEATDTYEAGLFILPYRSGGYMKPFCSILNG